MLKKLKEGDLIKFTMNYEQGTGFFGIFGLKKVKQGQQGMAIRPSVGLLGYITHTDIKLPDGTLLKDVPAKYWTA